MTGVYTSKNRNVDNFIACIQHMYMYQIVSALSLFWSVSIMFIIIFVSRPLGHSYVQQFCFKTPQVPPPPSIEEL